MGLHTDGIALLLCSLGIGCSAGQDAVQADVHMPATTSSALKVEAASKSSSSTPKACSADAECSPGFCDLGVCAQAMKLRKYGSPCTIRPPPPPPPPLPSGFLPGIPSAVTECGAYMCQDGKCRSCQSDAACGKGSTCEHTEGWPGKSCGDYSRAGLTTTSP